MKPRKNEKRPTYLNRGGTPRDWRLQTNFLFDCQGDGFELFDGIAKATANEEQIRRQAESLQNAEGDLQLYVTSVIDESLIDIDPIVKAMDEAPERPINLEIDTPGGSVTMAMRLFNALSRHEGTVTARVTGQAASSGMLLSQAADVVQIHDNATMMAHPVQIMMFALHNDPQQLRDDADFAAEMLEKGNEQIIDLLSIRSGQNRKSVSDMIFAKGGNGTTITGAEAVELGFADELLEMTPRNGKQANYRAARNIAIAKARARLAELDAYVH